MSGHDLVDAATVLDWVRSGRPVWFVHAGTAESFRRAHLPGALRFDAPAQAAAVLRPDDHVVVYGEVADAEPAAGTVRTLLDTGFASTFRLAGGLPAWRAAGGPVEGARPR